MHTPYRIAAIPEPEPPDEADLYELRLRARARRGRRVITGVCGALSVLSLAALFETPPRRRTVETVEDRAAARIANARDTIVAARELVQREQARFTATMSAALDADITPDAAHPRCDVELPEATRLVHGKHAFPLLVVARGDRVLPSPSLAALLADVNRADEHLAAGRTVEAVAYANALAVQLETPQSRLRQDVVLVTSSMKHPVRTTPTSFEPGELTGRVYLYDFAQRRVVCAGDVHATSSRQIEYNYVPSSPAAAMAEGPRLTASLDEDLEVQIQRAIARGALVQVR